MIIAVLTGDIINSRHASSPDIWIQALKNALGKDESNWEIYRGDSFQMVLSPQEALLKAIYIKACLKTLKNSDVRIGIGIGEQGFVSSSPSESNGEAFIYSGEKLESLKKERVNLAIKTRWKDFDYEVNVAIKLALIAMDNWSPTSAEMVKIAIENPGLSQKDLAIRSHRSQSSVSEALKRANFTEVMELSSLYQKKLKSIILT